MEDIIIASNEKCHKLLMALRDSLDLFIGKWKFIILLYLDNDAGEKKYFMKMRRDLFGISAKVLASELKNLEVNQLVVRIVHTSPAMVEYALTDHGRSVLPLIYDMIEWGGVHRRKILKQ